MILFDVYKKMLLVQVVASVTAFLGVMLDNLVISRFLGTTCMAAFGFAQPIVFIMVAIALILCIGTQGMAGKLLGNGDIDGVSAIVSIDILISAVLGIVFTIILFVFSRDIVMFLGARGETIELASLYIKGFSFNIFSILIGPCLTSTMQIDNDIKRSYVAIVVMTVSGFLLNLVNVFIVHGGMFGMGFTTTISSALNVIILLLHFCKKDIMFRPRLSLVNFKRGVELVLMGLPAAVQQTCIVCRTAIINIIVFSIAGNAAVAAFTVQNAMVPLVMAVIKGVGSTTIMIASTLIAMRERYSLEVLMMKIYKLSILLSLVECAILFVFAKYIAILFVGVDQIEQCMLVMRVFRFYAVSIPLCMIVTLTINFYQSMKKLILANVAFIFEIVIFCVIFAFSLSKIIGLDGVWLAFTCAEIASIIMLLIVIVYNQKRFPKKFSDILMMPDNFGVDKEHRINVTVKSKAETSKISEEIMNFCQKNGIDKKRSMYSALCMEGMSNVTFDNNADAKKECMVDVFMTIVGQDLRICLRDNGKEFDPVKQRDILNPKDPASNVAIRMFYHMAKEYNYNNLFTMNVLTFKV